MLVLVAYFTPSCKGIDTVFIASLSLDIIAAKKLKFETNDNLLKVICTGETGKTAFVTLHVASGIGGGEIED